jgi:hypothetical protein
MKVIKSNKIRWKGNVVHKREIKKRGNSLVEEPEESDLLEDLTADRTEMSLKRNSEGAYPQSSRVQSDLQRCEKDYLTS